jgi:hypothetical protein
VPPDGTAAGAFPDAAGTGSTGRADGAVAGGTGSAAADAVPAAVCGAVAEPEFTSANSAPQPPQNRAPFLRERPHFGQKFLVTLTGIVFHIRFGSKRVA